MIRTALMTSIAGLLIVVGCDNKDSSDGSDDGSTSGSDDGSAGGGGGSAEGVPVADAGQDQTLAFAGAVVLDGSGSYDPEGDDLTYTWTFDHAPEGSLMMEEDAGVSPNSSDAAVAPTFVPDSVGTYVVQLIVSDGENSSAPDFVVITVEDPSTLPVADAGTDQVVDQGAAVSLDGSRSYDPDGLTLSYEWEVVQAPDGSALSTATLTGKEGAAPNFTADLRGGYTLNLIVNNGLIDSMPDAVNITATGLDGVPTANAGPDIASYDCTHVELDASASADPEGTALIYYWELQTKPAGSTVSDDAFSDRSAADPTFFADMAGVYTVSVTVSDGVNWATPDTVVLDLSERTYNSPPVITFLPYPTVAAGTVACEESGYGYDCDECDNQVIQLSDYVTVTDPDNDPFTIEWELSVGNGTITDPTSLDTTIILEDIEAEEPDECAINDFDVVLTAIDCVGAPSGVSSEIAIIQAECCGTLDTDTGDTGLGLKSGTSGASKAKAKKPAGKKPAGKK